MIGKEDAILVGPFIGEMFWEFFRFVPHVINTLKTKYENKDLKVFVYTRPDRFDMYGKWANEFIPLEIEGDGLNKFGECFRMMNLNPNVYHDLARNYYEIFNEKYNIVEHIYFKNIDIKKDYLNKNYYTNVDYDYQERESNKLLVDDFLKDVTKKIVIIAPRFRYNFKRNWPYWNKFYDIIYQNKYLMDNFEFIICGKENEYVPDIKKRFLDINNIKIKKGSSLIGLLMSLFKSATFTIGSQSAIPNISLLFGVPTLEWGNQKTKHTVDYNIRKTDVTFLEDMTFEINPHFVFINFMKLAKELTND